ncbi:DUF2694 domain-containing protein [Mycobacterium ulcerans]|uniref:DUF2694 domain-containing protein n=3 Tax=Mycobacterium ulcerans group TaxID=2993898 RepID=B6CM06_MYCL1|nr:MULTISPECIES: hypothetical protein [Mycobacterium ulcerans group]EUA86290.1 hypothetical protein I551_7272 [Mycobacterium ulcerans str. Harvey]ACA57643.1 conserved hypothetical protein [Mycobacterium liflandii 128FXT]MEB3905704.1 DUF2694 domain-containing protein [Mycobacterium ulcerans]MEB3909887.1 DUF2694 domain-containing protein [Mycobacterium ulcerans]MEB3920150.1 DUF2694 domain-containing protein [Mycobacterium ulcerans]
MFEARLTDYDTVVFEAASHDESIVVAVGRGGNALGVELQAPAMALTDAELANRIVKLNTLAHLRSQAALRHEWEAQHVNVSATLPTEDQVAGYEALIDF